HVTTVSTASGTVFVYDHGMGAWINVIYSYTLMIIGMILLFQTVINSPGLYRYQAGLLLVGAMVPLLLNAVYLADLFPDPGVDPTPIAFFITGLVSAWSIFRFRFLNIMPVAHTAIFNNMSGAVVVFDAKNRIVETNSAARKLLGLDGNVLGQSADSVMKNVQDFVIPDEETRKHYETRLGSQHCWLDVQIKPLHGNNSFLGHLVSLTDITRTKIAEENAQKALEEKELLMKEIHHRVKNNLMVISSLLNLQSRYVKDEEARDILKESRNRANSMALIHERLYGFSDLKNINFGEYTRSLTTDLFRNYAVDTSNIKLEMAVEDIQLDVDTAVPLGLILNELISNCLKYAFLADNKGTLKIVFKKEDDNCILKVKDDGVGIPANIDVKKSDTLGLTLVRGLVEQIEGPSPMERLETMKKCSDAGFKVGIINMPVLPFLSDSSEDLEAMIKSAKIHGAEYIIFSGLTLYGDGPDDCKMLYYQFLENHFPELVLEYKKLFSSSFAPSKRYQMDLAKMYHEISAKYGVKNRII
ncbi:MAG: PAS domain S-box protein, partial [Methanobacterium paludis]|nr:PAS domain S-box protein [Methanobacterium paludis]